jgi:type II secretory pathway pseudopilin PulG
VGWLVLTPSSGFGAPGRVKHSRGVHGDRHGITLRLPLATRFPPRDVKTFLGFSVWLRSFREFRGEAGSRRAEISIRRKGLASRRGISLLEAVVAIAIVGITSVSALEAVGGDMRTAERARRAIVVEALAGSRLEFMDLLNDRELQALPDSVESGKFPAALDEYSWKTTSAPVSDQAGVYAVRVTIDWPTGSYVVRTYQYRQPPFATRR